MTSQGSGAARRAKPPGLPCLRNFWIFPWFSRFLVLQVPGPPRRCLLMSQVVSARALVLLLLPGVVLAGCGQGYGGRKEIRGTVKLKGQPLDEGVIDFTPISGDQATKEGALIKNGSYHIDRAHGLLPGKYRVTITSGDGRTPANTDEPPGPSGANIISKDRIPPEYNINSKVEIEVTEKGPNVFDFEIP